MISIEHLYNLFLQSSEVSTDTRSIAEGNLFFCLKGENFNGNTFASQALEKGASFVVVDEPEYQLNERCILVDNSLSALQKLAKFHRKKSDVLVVGITGTNGKTTTKELLQAVLSEKYKVTATKGNLNNHIGVPLTVLSIQSDTDIAIVEMGANHVGEIKELCYIAQPNMGIITNIGKAHLEGFGSVENIIETKAALYQFVKQSKGLLFVNADDELLLKLSEGMRKKTYGCAGYYKGMTLGNDLFLKLRLVNEEVNIRTQLTGGYNFYNVMAAAAVGLQCWVPARKIKSAIEAYIPENNRSQIIQRGERMIILDAYNANPSSMKMAIDNIANMDVENKVLLLGDMAELGASSTIEHQQIVSLIRNYSFDYVYLLGYEFAKTNAPAAWLYQNYEHLKATLEKEENGVRTIEKAVEIKKTKVKSTVFSIPSDYKMFPNEEEWSRYIQTILK
jgi:UDP-N-acetylmuramoyl-tripeptide--D-alanyl-D-alanine ligase